MDRSTRKSFAARSCGEDLTDLLVLGLCWRAKFRKEDGINDLSSLLEEELIKTWALLFSSSDSTKGRRKVYASLPEPYWFVKHKTINGWLNREGVNRYTEIRSHLNHFSDLVSDLVSKGAYSRDCDEIIKSTLRGEPLNYSCFPVYEQRLHELRAYMDSRKPQGLRQLVHDNRDSLTYYTLWGVIVLLAVFSLGIFAAQSLAGFRALQPAQLK